ncbi:hypothetical protein OPV22_006160 [Ensete ventricosum]|uniref:non-specific serine/threonine protein kinase n=1 Tax=Ensete ventricosum TaxID=4639 RepID=A0AAV8RP37_ENSVE|nr:hypothetical protein OPV22_006160 [Ensete ventricosum]
MDPTCELKISTPQHPSADKALGGHESGSTKEQSPSAVWKSQNSDAPVLEEALKPKGALEEQNELAPDVDSFRSMDSFEESRRSSFNGASHPPEPMDTDLVKTVYVAIDQEKSNAGCLMRGLSVKGPFMEDLSIRVPVTKPNAALLSPDGTSPDEPNESGAVSSPFSVPHALQSMETTFLPPDSEEKECVWDASLPPSGNVSPHSSIDSSCVATAMSVVNSCTNTYRSDGMTSDGMLSLERACESTKGSVIGDSLGSAKTSISRASDSSGLSDDSSWSNVTGSANKPHKGNDPRWKAILAVRSRDGILGMSHFRLLKRLGCGDIGSVYLSELSSTRCYFAMKVMDKASLASRKKLTRAQTEREILQLLDHPFLPTLYTHFETDRFSCLVMEFCPGGDLHTLRQRQPGKHFSEYAARFYAAEVLLALEYLHMLGVVYRDLKPENILPSGQRAHFVSNRPALSLLQFVFSRHASCQNYFPIKVRKRQGNHGLRHQGSRTPFKGSGNRATLFNVVGQQLRFPDTPSTSYASRDLIRGLLVKEPQHRLGVKRGAAEIKQHPFFEGVNWALIRCSTPPEVPRPVEAELPAKFGSAEGFGTSGKRIVGADVKSGGKYLDFEFF